MSTNEELIGRADVNDLEAIMAVSNTDVDEAIHAVKDNAEAIFTWDYEKGQRPALNRLYEKAKTSQWNGSTDLPWDTDVDQEAVVMANATATHRLVCPILACVAGSGERQLRFDVVGDDGVDDLAVDPAVGLEVDAHPIGRRRGNRHGLFDTDADEPGMVIEVALPAAERQQVGIMDKGFLQTLAEAVGIKAGPSRLDNDLKINRPRPGRSDRALVLSQMVDSVQNRSPCITANRIKVGPCGYLASV